jgi:hypothetical protein
MLYLPNFCIMFRLPWRICRGEVAGHTLRSRAADVYLFIFGG